MLAEEPLPVEVDDVADEEVVLGVGPGVAEGEIGLALGGYLVFES